MWKNSGEKRNIWKSKKRAAVQTLTLTQRPFGVFLPQKIHQISHIQLSLMCVSPLLLLAIAVIWFASNSILINSKVQIPCSLPSLWWACQLDHSHKLCFHLQRGWCHWHRWSWNSFDRNFQKTEIFQTVETF